jgi:ABC-type glycerol-3-phosphate transport system substrate-binding protein
VSEKLTPSGHGLSEALQAVLDGRINRREFLRRAGLAGVSSAAAASLLSRTVAAQSAAPGGAGSFDPMRYAGTRLSVLVRSGETDERGLQDKIPEVRDRFGIEMEVNTLELGPLLEKTAQVVTEPESPYDIISVVAIQVPAVVAPGHFVPLNDFIADPSRTPADYDFPDFPEPSVANVNWDPEAQTYSADKDIALIPGIHSGSVLAFYRQDLFDAAGLEIPKTWDEFQAAAAALNSPPDHYGVSIIGANDFSLTSVDWWHRYANIGGVLFTGSIKDSTFTPQVNTSEGIQALQMMIDVLPYCSPNVTSFGFQESTDNFATGKTAMMVLWSTIAGTIFNPDTSTVYDKIVGVPVPTNLPDGKPQSFLGGWGIGIPKNSPNIDAAYHLLTYISSKEFDKYQTLTYQSDPNRLSTMRDPEINELIPSMAAGAEAIVNGHIFEAAYTPDYVELITVSNTEFNIALLGQQTAEEACAKVQTAWEEIGHRSGWLA